MKIKSLVTRLIALVTISIYGLQPTLLNAASKNSILNVECGQIETNSSSTVC